MSKVMIDVGTLRGRQQVNSFDMVAPMGFNTGLSKVDNLVKPAYLSGNNVMAPPIMNRAIQNPAVFKAVGCKNETQTHLIIRRRPLPNYIGTYPQPGVFRHEKKGLAYDPQKPNNLPLMPIASSFFGGANNKLGQPPG
jgi:hypothetical protein